MGSESLFGTNAFCRMQKLSFTLYIAFCPYFDVVLPHIVRREQDTYQLWLRPTLRVARRDFEDL